MQSILSRFRAFVAPLVGAVFVSGMILVTPAAVQAAPVLVFAPTAALKMSASNNWAGYVATGGTYTAVSGAWTVPNVPAVQGFQADAAWVGIGGVNTQDLIQAGTEEIVQNGSVSYKAWYEILPAMPVTVPLSVSPGDSISVALGESSPNHWQLVFRNFSTGKSYQTVIPYVSGRASAEWVEEMPLGQDGFVSLDSFGAVNFLGGYTTVDGMQKNIQTSGAQRLNMTSGQVALATPSILSGDGAGFQVARSNAAAPVSGKPFQVAVAAPTVTSEPGRGTGVSVTVSVYRERVTNI